MSEAVDADVAGVLAETRSCTAKVPENRRALMLQILAPQLSFGREKSIAAAGIDDVARLQRITAALIGAHVEPGGARALLLHCRHFVAFAGVGAAFAGMLVEHPVEILAPNLVGVRRALADGAGEREGVVAAPIVGFEIRAGLEYAECAHLVEHSQPLEHRKIHRQQRFADVEARMTLLLERDHTMAAPRQQRRRGTACRTAPDHRDVACLGCHYTSTLSMPPLLARFTYSGSQSVPSKFLASSTTM